MADNRNTLTDEILVLAETLGDIKARFERVESEFAIQSRPLEAALAALSAAMTGIKTLQHHVLDNSLSALSLKVEEQRKAIDDQINVIVSELKGADAQNDEKIALQTAELKQQFAEICANVQQLSSQFDAQIKRVELEAKEQITKFAAVTGPQGPAGASFNPKGNWQEGVFYQRLDVVSLLGTSYVSNVDNNASKPTKNSDRWTVLAARAANVGGGGAGNFASLAGIAEVSQGGTGITQYAIGDILYANDTGSLARLPAGVNGQFLKTTGAGGAPEWETPTGGGDVVGPASATDNALVRFDGTSGTAIQNSNATLTDAGALTLASTINVTDVILGTSGPSVKSSLDARAARQGLIYDGTTSSSATLSSAIGTSDFSASVWFQMPPSSSAKAIFSIGSFGNARSFNVYVDTGVLNFVLFGATGGDYSNAVISGVDSLAGKYVQLSVTRVGSTLTAYINGIATAFTGTGGAGTQPTFAGTITSTTVSHGGMPNFYFVGMVGQLYLYNRALSASEVVSLYEAGAPAGADYNSASNTNAILNVSRNSDFSAGATDWSSLNGATISVVSSTLNVVASAAGQVASLASSYFGGNFKVGKRYRLTFTVSNFSSGDTLRVSLGGSNQVVADAVNPNGTYTYEWTASGSDGTFLFFSPVNSARTYNLDNIEIYPLGLLLAPDAAQAGGGLVWYDTSGNAANISWTSGVSWNVPSSGTTGGNRLFTGVVEVNNDLYIGSGNIIALARNNPTYNTIKRDTTNGGILLTANGNTAFLKDNGNFLIGTTTDLGYRLGINGASDKQLVLDVSAGGRYTSQYWANSGSIKAQAYYDATANSFRLGATAASSSTILVSGGDTTALTLDSSQNATFAGTIAVQGTAARIYSGTGSPEGVVTAETGSIYMNLSGGNNTTFYVKQSGSGNTGWNAK